MKNLLLLVFIGLAAYGGYSIWNNHREAAPPPQVAETNTEETAAPPVMASRQGPALPNCSQAEDAPGPPLNRKVTGRVRASAPSS